MPGYHLRMRKAAILVAFGAAIVVRAQAPAAPRFDLDELSIAAWHAGARDEGKRAAERLVAEKRFPPSERERIEKNLTWYR